jgi:hypothetical protein
MRHSSKALLGAMALVVMAGALAAPMPAFAQDKKACVKREMAKGRSACIAKAKCDGITSRQKQAKLCDGVR